MDDIVIGKGDLVGKGVYANRDFRKGEVVVRYNLRVLTKAEYGEFLEREKMFTHIRHGVIYLYSEPERYVNHSNSPNTYRDFSIDCDVALRDIQKGEMITTDATQEDF